MSRKRATEEYALYKGDKFIDLGTPEYLADLIGCEVHTIFYYASPSYKKRTKKDADCYIAVGIPEEDDDEPNVGPKQKGHKNRKIR